MFCNRRQLRRWAACVGLLWLFGVAAGAANACLLSDASRFAAQPVATHGLADDHQDHDQDGAPGKANCLDFCDKSSAATPAVKVALDFLDVVALPPAESFEMLPAPIDSEPSGRVVSLIRCQGAPPIRIAFLRLSL